MLLLLGEVSSACAPPSQDCCPQLPGWLISPEKEDKHGVANVEPVVLGLPEPDLGESPAVGTRAASRGTLETPQLGVKPLLPPWPWEHGDKLGRPSLWMGDGLKHCLISLFFFQKDFPSGIKCTAESRLWVTPSMRGHQKLNVSCGRAAEMRQGGFAVGWNCHGAADGGAEHLNGSVLFGWPGQGC